MGNNGSLFYMLFMYAVIFGIFYWFVLRRQKKKATEARNMLSNLEVGDKVITIGGLYGIIDEVNQTENYVVLDCDGVYLTYDRNAIRQVIQKNSAATVSVDELKPKAVENHDEETTTEQ
ncbi:preprotein translocase subunit YajC [Atopobacter phocae]|uniref:preprotein translocase subunit YajC n=1 Tax=Atopobacter phocae TaxID=136492 RepID=UPI00046F61B2|nr:preprotein translocase subunit YajC [Atopobacter phocae]